MKSPKPRHERLAEFFRRLAALPRATSAEEARRQIASTLTAVEDELTDIPSDPDSLGNDGRLYPPQDDSVRSVPGRSDVVRLRSRRHNTFVRSNGAIEIQAIDDKRVVFEKPGSDGRKVWEA
jgi:hypothetical protein